MASDTDPEDLASEMTRDHEDIEKPEVDSRHDQEVNGGDPICIISKKCLLAL